MLKKREKQEKCKKISNKSLFKKQQGITLVALVITIIVLLILAGITIGTLSGDNGILNNTGKAKEDTEISNEKEIVGTAVVQAIGKNKRGNLELSELQDELDDITKEGVTEVSEIRKKLVVEFTDSNRMYYIDDSGNVYEYTYTDLAIMENGVNFNNRMADYRAKIVTVTILDNMNIPEDVYQVFDVSKDQNESIKAWLIENVEDSNMYDLYIGGNDGVKIENCSQMFESFTNCTNINLEFLYTEDVSYFNHMFYNDSKLVNLTTASNFVTSNAKELRYMFYLCTRLENINTSNWDISNVTDMFGTFRMCQSIESLDLGSFDTSNVVYTDYLFQYCQKLKTIYVSDKWNNDKVTSSFYMFQGCSSLNGAVSFSTTNANDITFANYSTGYFTLKSS